MKNLQAALRQAALADLSSAPAVRAQSLSEPDGEMGISVGARTSIACRISEFRLILHLVESPCEEDQRGISKQSVIIQKSTITLGATDACNFAETNGGDRLPDEVWQDVIGLCRADTALQASVSPYLTFDGGVLEADPSVDVFPRGTQIKHFGYDLTSYSSPLGPNSLYGLLNQTLFDPILPVWLDSRIHNYRRVIKGSRNALNGAVDAGRTSGSSRPRPRPPVQPIPLHEPPTFVRFVWNKDDEVTFFANQRRYLRIETDAHTQPFDGTE
jgi:hypothetical protein